MKRTGFKQRKRKCPQCKDWFMPFNSMQKCCTNPKCALEQGKIDRRKRELVELKQRKDKIKSRSEWLREAQAAFNSYIRIRDKGRPCISCQSKMDWNAYGGKVDSGHYRSIGSAPNLRFNPLNCHAQCVKCNRYLSSNTVEYRIGLIGKIGVSAVENIESLNKPMKLSVESIKRIKRIYNKKAKLYKRLFRYEQD